MQAAPFSFVSARANILTRSCPWLAQEENAFAHRPLPTAAAAER